jgi:uncharacterized protein YbjT (DUF2867 family)
VAAVKVLAGGGSGLAGSRLCPALAETGHDVVTMTRHPGSYDGAGAPIRGDVHDPATLSTALADGETACYLVHSLSGADFQRGPA